LSSEPFLFTHHADDAEVLARLRDWMEQTLLAGLETWRREI